VSVLWGGVKLLTVCFFVFVCRFFLFDHWVIATSEKRRGAEGLGVSVGVSACVFGHPFNALQCIAMCCSVLQCKSSVVFGHPFNVLQYVAVCCNVGVVLFLVNHSMRCSALQCVAVC